MLTEDYVSFEIAKLLKEKGFNEFTFSDYNENGIAQFNEVETIVAKGYQRPTLQMAMKWLREEKRTSIIIEFDLTKRGYNPYVYQPDYDMDWVVKWRRNLPMKYEEACEAALKYTIENLI